MKIRFLIPLTEVIGVPPRWIIRTERNDTLPMHDFDVIKWRSIHPGKVASVSYNGSEFISLPSHPSEVVRVITSLKGTQSEYAPRPSQSFTITVSRNGSPPYQYINSVGETIEGAKENARMNGWYVH